MPNNPSEKGFGDGYSDKPADNKDKVEGVLDRGAAILGDILIPDNSLYEADKAAKQYDDAYAAGQAKRKSES